jgi:hypothetical protein
MARSVGHFDGPRATRVGFSPGRAGLVSRVSRRSSPPRALPAPNYMVIYVFWVKLDGPNYIIYVHCGLGQITCSLYIFWAKLDGPPPGQSGQRTGPAPGHKPRQWPMPVRTPGQARYRAILSGLGPGHGSRAKWPTILFSTTRVIKFETVASRYQQLCRVPYMCVRLGITRTNSDPRDILNSDSDFYYPKLI